jgi:hypothetical protein
MIVEGSMSSDGAYHMAYGLYLLGGGTPDGFYDLTIDDVQTILSVHNGVQARLRDAIARDISKMFGSGNDTQ